MPHPDLNNAIYRMANTITDGRYRLFELVDAMDRLGLLPHVAEEITNFCELLHVQMKEVQSAYTQQLTADLRHSEAMMGNLLKATLEGCIVPKEKSHVSSN